MTPLCKGGGGLHLLFFFLLFLSPRSETNALQCSCARSTDHDGLLGDATAIYQLFVASDSNAVNILFCALGFGKQKQRRIFDESRARKMKIGPKNPYCNFLG